MTTDVVAVDAPVPTQRPLLRRAAGVVAILAIAAGVTIAAQWSPTARAVDVLAKYSPARFAAGRVWTLPTSAFLLGHPRMIGPTTVFVMAIFLPYAFARGIERAAVVGMSGHVVSTMVVAAVVLPAAAMGWSTATTIVHESDFGPSAALAACAGGLAVVLARRWRSAGAVVAALVAGWFLYSLLYKHSTSAHVADIEHLIALMTGVIVERHLGRRRT